eukprot:sb/3479215/
MRKIAYSKDWYHVTKRTSQLSLSRCVTELLTATMALMSGKTAVDMTVLVLEIGNVLPLRGSWSGSTFIVCWSVWGTLSSYVLSYSYINCTQSLNR